MKTTAITIFLLVFLIPGAEAGILLKLKNGNTMTWSNFTEEADQYCTQKSSGKFCMPKSAVASIAAKDEEDPNAVVIVNKTSDAEKEASRNELLDSRKKKECEEIWTEIQSAGSEAIRKGSFTKTAEAMSLRRKYNAKCQTPEQDKAYNESMKKTFNNINQQNKQFQQQQEQQFQQQQEQQFQQQQITDRTNSNSSCSSDFSCGIGYKCVKAPYNTSGACMRSVDEYGVQKHDLPRLNSIDPKYEGDCQFNTDCPIGFRCDTKYKACVK